MDNSIYRRLKIFSDLLDSAPQEPESSPNEDDLEVEDDIDGSWKRVNATQSSPISIVPLRNRSLASFMVTSNSMPSWPVPEEAEEMEAAKRASTAANSPSVCEHKWRLSRRSFSSHLARLSKLVNRGLDQQSLLIKMVQTVLVEFEVCRYILSFLN